MQRLGLAERRPVVLFVVASLCLAAVVFASAHPSRWMWVVPDWTFRPAPLPSMPPADMGQFGPAEQPPPAPSPIGRAIWTVLAIAVAAVVLALVARWVYRAVKALLATRIALAPARDDLPVGVGLPGKPLTPQQVKDAVGEAIERLDNAPNPTDAVILAWLALEDAAKRHGMARDPAQTPTEFTAGLLDASAVPRADTVNLRTLYLRTRFSHQAAATNDVEHARAWLLHIARAMESTADEVPL